MLATGKDDQEYRLEILLQCLSKRGLCLKKSKCIGSFMMSSVQDLGHHIIHSKGLHAAKEKFKAIVEAPRPEY